MKWSEFEKIREAHNAQKREAQPIEKKHYSYPESQIQRQCVKWFRLQYPTYNKLLFHIPNERKILQHQGARMNDEGRVSGVADLFLLIPSDGFHALFIEVKSAKGRQNGNQKAWQKEVERFNYKYLVIRSLQEFQNAVNEYLHRLV